MKVSTVVYRLFIGILLFTTLFSGCIVICYIIDALQQNAEYGRLAAMVEHARTEKPIQFTDSLPHPTADLDTKPLEISTEPLSPTILPEYVAAYNENTDLVGWMCIAGTPINYPVMQTPDRVDYYLYRNFAKQDNAHGCLYVRESCDVFAPSDNLTIYGHHMNDGSMFTGLDKYRKEEFWKEYPTIQFDTLYTRQTYTVFAVFKTTASAGYGFRYHLFENAEDEEAFEQFVSTCKSLAFYDTGITPVFGDKLITLSTCEYSQNNGRLVVVAVRDK